MSISIVPEVGDLKWAMGEIEDGSQPAVLELYSSLRIRAACQVFRNGNAHGRAVRESQSSCE